jgi:hypothetical protein
MCRRAICSAVALVVIGCGTTRITDAEIDSAAARLDLGGFSSETLTVKAWQARADKDYPALFAYTRACVERYGEEGKRMNAEMTNFAPSDRVAEKWALNDVGTSLFIMGHAYADLKMYGEAAQAFDRLAADYGYAQCWDPRGWYWRPAQGAKEKAQRFRHLAGPDH